MSSHQTSNEIARLFHAGRRLPPCLLAPITERQWARMMTPFWAPEYPRPRRLKPTPPPPSPAVPNTILSNGIAATNTLPSPAPAVPPPANPHANAGSLASPAASAAFMSVRLPPVDPRDWLPWLRELRARFPASEPTPAAAIGFQRIQLLQQATKIEDYDYLICHQLMCYKALGLPLPPELQNSASVNECLDLMNPLVQTSGVSPDWLELFKDFPATPGVLRARWQPEYTNHLSRFIRFAEKVQRDGWATLQMESAKKGHPPTVLDMETAMHLYSAVFQGVINRAVFRKVHHYPDESAEPYDHILLAADDAFAEHQRKLAEIRSSTTSQDLRLELELDEAKRHRQVMMTLGSVLPKTGAHRRRSTVPSPASINPQRQGPALLPAALTQGGPMYTVPHQPPMSAPVALAPATAELASMHRQMFHHPGQLANGVNTSGQRVRSVNPRLQPRPQGHVQHSMPLQYAPQHQVHHPQGQLSLNQVQADTMQVYPQPSPSNGPSRPIASRAAPQAAHQMHARRASGIEPQAVQPQVQQPAPLFAPSGYRLPSESANVVTNTLHLSYLRPPALKIDPAFTGNLFEYVAYFALKPMTLRNSPRQTCRFHIPPQVYAALPADDPPTPFVPATRFVTNGSKSCRLRIAKVTPDALAAKGTALVEDAPVGGVPMENAPVEEHLWALQETVWPRGLTLKLNNNPIHYRLEKDRKGFPIDIRANMLSTSESNVLEIDLIRMGGDPQRSEFAVAIEVLVFVSSEVIKEDCISKRHVPSAQILNRIKQSLNPPVVNDDIQILDSNISISLLDPITQITPCDIPVKGQDCLHHQCFDLSTFLSTRFRLSPNSPAFRGPWKCPICNKDARPNRLKVNGFLRRVISELSASGRVNTREIVVNSDGTWRPRR